MRVRLENILKQYDELEQVTLTGYKGRPALDHVSLDIHDGETMSIVGPSGCGKSTMLKIVAGLEMPQAGKLFYNDFDMTNIKPQDRGIGMVFQDYALYPVMKGKGNLAYYFQMHQKSEAEMEARVRQTAELMGVDFELLLGRLPDTLSGGEKQRVAIARCIVRDPLVFLMDEPIVNLDAKRRERTRIEIKKLLKKFGITTIYVTHDQQEAIFMGDRITVMRDGVIEQVGTFDELYYSPVNLFVATFIGTPPITILPVQVANGQVIVSQVNHAWNLPEHIAASLPQGALRMGIRPEGWVLNTPDGVTLSVSHIERIPTERAAFVHGNLAGKHINAIASLEQPETKAIALTPDWDKVYFFAAEGEEVIYTPGTPDFF
ncbi:ABC transporter ATP-binding protein [Tengunoibacter tsumagoiensis]|uniref:Sugar ABC transporter ATP-binding protein n=1 Tax=Tengunoibacter tsumagoiensis TaxID=2014871 RepID=A0A402A3Z8_9CHLR|nr:ABC transporter ATP-binding protein [Tengunoibacter tsumagoiensis]GCE13779.1 sugar ABC transporter ATP-binding protein [Tengunoibacter tsumagoiensis]